MTLDEPRDSFVEICIYEVKAGKAEDFEQLLRKVLKHHSEFPGVIDIRYVKRTHRPVDFSGAKGGEPAIRLTRARDSEVYVLYWELIDKVAHAEATKSGLEHFFSDFRRCLVKPPKIILGERIR
ncbi:MAG: hypothetical protein ABR978_07600 [Dehalococcoidia bacterium]|jgi:heme-degrading monooxygenase HmoA